MWLLQMVDFVLVGGRQVRHQRPVMTSDNGTATASRLSIINPVLRAKTYFGARILEDIGVLVAANASDVKNRIGRKNVLIQKRRE